MFGKMGLVDHLLHCIHAEPTLGPRVVMSSPHWRTRRYGERPMIYGRERERTQLRELLDDAVAGHGSLVLISGEAGIGKTTLVDDLIYEAEERSCLVLTGGCYDLTTTPPYGPWVEVTRSYPEKQDGLPRVPAALREGGGMEGIGSQAALFDLIAGFLVDIAAHQTLVIVLEDLHWSDPASLELLRVVVRIIPGHRILLVGTYRDDELTRRHELYQLMPVLVRESGAQRIDLNRLDAREIQALLTERYDLSASDEERLRDHLHRLSEGNPFYLSELVRSLETDGVLKRDGDGWELVGLASVQVPPLIRQVIDGRLSGLGPEIRSALEIAAVIGHRFGFELWSSVSEINDELLLDSLEEALEAHILVEQAGAEEYQFSHALVRETLYEGLVRPRRRIWHRKVADALITTPNPDPDEVADHLQRSNDPRAEEWLMLAGQRAQERFAWSDAESRFEAVLDSMESRRAHPRDRGWLVFRLSSIADMTEWSKKVPLLELAWTLGDEAGDRLLTACSRWQHSATKANSTGNFQFGVSGIESAVEAWDQLSDEEFRRSYPLLVANFAFRRIPGDRANAVKDINLVRASLPHWYMQVGRFKDAVRTAENYLDSIARHELSDSQLDLGIMRMGLSLSSAYLGDPSTAQREIQLLGQEHRSTGHFLEAAVDTAGELTSVHIPFYTDDITERKRLAQQFDDDWERASRTVTEEIVFNPCDLLNGRWQKARRDLEFGGPLTNRGQWYAGVLAGLTRLQGEPELAWERISSVFPDGSKTPFGTTVVVVTMPMQRVAAELCIDGNDWDAASDWLNAHDAWLAESEAVLGRAEGQLLWGRYYFQRGDLQKAREHAEEALAHASDPRQPLALMQIRRFLGELFLAEGDHAMAETWLQESLELAKACAIPFEEALTLLEIARLRTAVGDREDARRLLDKVREICEPLEARPTLEQLDEIEALLSTPQQDVPAYPHDLSQREVEVLRLVVEGMTDGEIAEELYLSPRTISTYLSSIYNKLGVNSRAAAAAITVRSGLA